MEVLFGRKRKEPSTSHEAPLAPPADFSEEVLDLEGKIDVCCSISSVKRLMELYSLAMEYYESQQDPKYLHYQDRLHSLLSREDVMFLLENPSVRETSESCNQSSLAKRRKEIQAKQRSLVGRLANNSLNSSDLAIDRTAEKTLQNHQMEFSTTFRMLQNNLKSQCDALHSRISERKAKKKKELRHKGQLNNAESDRSGGLLSCSSSQIEGFEAEIEEIMERYIEEKHSVKQEIEGKYNEQIAVIREMRNDALFNHVRERMKRNMKSEIEEECYRLKRKKTEELSRIRSVYL